jgi:hypothetical protein
MDIIITQLHFFKKTYKGYSTNFLNFFIIISRNHILYGHNCCTPIFQKQNI